MYMMLLELAKCLLCISNLMYVELRLLITTLWVQCLNESGRFAVFFNLLI
jgi:hypothetical protein